MKLLRLLKIAVSKLSLYSILWIWLITFMSIVLLARDRTYYSSLEMYQTQTRFNLSEEEQEYDYPSMTTTNNYEYDANDRHYNHPVLVWWTDLYLTRHDTITCESNYTCKVFTNATKPKQVDAFMFYGMHMNLFNLPLPRRPDDITWAIAYEESPKYAPYLISEKTLRLFNYSCTFSRWSDMPVTLQFMESLKSITSKKYFVSTDKKNSYLKGDLRIAPVLFIQSQCNTANDRNGYVEKLMEYIQIDSYGMCLKNNVFPRELQGNYMDLLNTGKYFKFIAKYKFIIAIENAECYDYITEKLWFPIKVGAVPVYFGSPTVRDWLPNNKSAILIQDFETPKQLGEYIKYLLANDELYEEHLEHKTKGIIRNVKLIKEIKTRPYETDHWYSNKQRFECYICEKLHQKKIRSDVHIVDKKHFDCLKPISMLTKKYTDYINAWNTGDYFIDSIYDYIVTNNVTKKNRL